MENLTNDDIAKISQNEKEEKSFIKQLDNMLNNPQKAQRKPLKIGTTPNVLAICGAKELELEITKKVIDKCLRPEIRDENGKLTGKTGHNLTRDQLVQSLLYELKHPMIVLKGSKENSLAVITDIKDKTGKPILIAVDMDIQSGRRIVNNVRSAYGRVHFEDFIRNNLESGNLIAYNKEKTDILFQSIEKKYLKEETVISFDNSIAYSMKSVKYPNEISQENTRSERETMEENTPYNLISIEIGGDVYHYRDNSENTARDTLRNYDNSEIKVNGEFTQNFERINETEYAKLEQSSNPPKFSMEINADENSLKLFQNEKLHSLSLSETLNKLNGRTDTIQATENIQTSTISPEVLKEVISDLSAPPAHKIDMMIDPKFDYLISADKFAEINEKVYGIENNRTNVQAKEETAATKENTKVNESEQAIIKKKADKLDEATNEILHKIRYADIAEVNADIIGNIENNTMEEFTQTREESIEQTDELDIISSLHQAADERNDGNAQNILGVCYFTGTTVPLDEQKGIEYFERAAEQENPAAMRNLAIVLETREPIDLKRSVELYQKSANKNDAFAQNNLGVCYLLGDGVDRNIRKALMYFEKASKNGDDYAMVNLADLYATGNGVRKNDKKAYEFYLQAAEKGNADGMKAAADCLLNGIGVKQDSQQALNFYKMAAEKGDMEAQNAYDKLESKLSPKKHEVSVDETQKQSEQAESKKTKKKDEHSR